MPNSSPNQDNKEAILRRDLTAATDALCDPSTDPEFKTAALRAIMGLSVELVDAAEERHVASRKHLESSHKEG